MNASPPLPKNGLSPESLYLFWIGLISILGQVVMLRELNIAFYGVELIYLLSIGGWLFWTGIGAFWGNQSYVPSLAAIRRLLIGTSVLPPVLIVAIRGFPLLPGAISGAYLPFSVQISLLFLLLAPPGLGFGLLFQWTARRFVRLPDTLAKAYAIESLGGLVGGVFSTLSLSFGIYNFSISILVLMLSLAGTLMAEKRAGRPLSRPPLFFFALSCLAFHLSPDWNREMIKWRHPTLTATHDTPYGCVTITGQGGQYAVFENNTLSFDTEAVNAEEIVHIAALQRPSASSVLIFGDAVRMLSEILKHAPRHVDFVDPDPVKIRFLQTHLPASAIRSLTSPHVLIHHTDPRRFLQTGASAQSPNKKVARSRLTGIRQRAGTPSERPQKKNHPYDLILSGMPDPSSGAANRFFTLEFFRQCSRRLTPDGILAFRFHSPENLWTRPVQYRNASIIKALKTVFPHVLVTSGLSYTVLASAGPLSSRPEKLSERLKTRNIQTRLITPEYIRYLLTGDRFHKTARQLRNPKSVVNSDRHPVCYFLSTVNWLTQFMPSLINTDIYGAVAALLSPRKLAAATTGTGIFLLLIFKFLRRSTARTRWMLAWIGGFTGMTLETLLILYYQSVSGILFGDIGLLIMAFMGGLSAGSIGVPRLLSTFGKRSRHIAVFLISGMICLNFFCLNLFAYDIEPPGFWLFFLLLFFSGAFSAGLFSFASLMDQAQQKEVVSPLYSADLLGGCVASLFTSLVLIPVLGMSYTVGFITMLSFTTFLLITR